jgi:hypothetical protein
LSDIGLLRGLQRWRVRLRPVLSTERSPASTIIFDHQILIGPIGHFGWVVRPAVLDPLTIDIQMYRSVGPFDFSKLSSVRSGPAPQATSSWYRRRCNGALDANHDVTARCGGQSDDFSHAFRNHPRVGVTRCAHV